MATLTVERPPHVTPDRVVDFDVWSPPGEKEDIHAAWERLHAEKSVVWTPHNGGHWIVTRTDPMLEVYEDYNRFSSRVLLVPKALGESFDMAPTTYDPPVNRPYRKVMQDSFSPKVVKGYEGKIRTIVIELIDAFKHDGHCRFREQFADPFPIILLMELMELPMADVPKFKYWAEQITRNLGDMTIQEAVDAFYDYLSPIVAERMGGSGTDLISMVANADMGGRPITHEEALKTVSQVLQAGVDTVAQATTFAFIALEKHPEMRRLLAADPSRISDFLEEVLRRYPLVMNVREIVQDTVLDGAVLKAGEMICMPNCLAGTDDTKNERPLEFDIDRKARSTLTFGAGAHRCVGAPLARLELLVVFDEWFKRIPEFHRKAGEKIEYKAGVTPHAGDFTLEWDPSIVR
jgi:camphor 5-monooxygenase